MELTYLLKRFLLSRAEVFRPTKKEVDGAVRGERKGNRGSSSFKGGVRCHLFIKQASHVIHQLCGRAITSKFTI